MRPCWIGVVLPPCLELVSQGVSHSLLFGVLGQVVLFQRIIVEVKKLLAPCTGVHNEFPAPVADHPLRVCKHAGHKVMHTCLFMPQQWREAVSRHGRRNRQAPESSHKVGNKSQSVTSAVESSFLGSPGPQMIKGLRMLCS